MSESQQIFAVGDMIIWRNVPGYRGQVAYHKAEYGSGPFKVATTEGVSADKCICGMLMDDPNHLLFSGASHQSKLSAIGHPQHITIEKDGAVVLDTLKQPLKFSGIWFEKAPATIS